MSRLLQHPQRPAPVHSVRRHFRRGWMLLLLLMAMLPFGQRAWAIDTSKPILSDVKTMSFPDKAHVSFRLKFFNYDGHNSGYIGNVWLYINGTPVIKLNEVWPTITYVRNEDWVKDDGDRNPGVLGQGSFKTDDGVYEGIVSISDLSNRDGNKWIGVTVDVVLNVLPWNKSYNFLVQGKWVDKIQDGIKYGEKIIDKQPYVDVATGSLAYPTIDWPAFYPKRTGNKVVEFYSTNMKVQTYPKNSATGKADNWIYVMRFSKEDNKNVNWPPSALQIKKYWDNKNKTAVDVNYHYKACTSGVTEAHATLELDNYQAHCIYPFISRMAPNYTFYPNSQSTAVTKSVSFNRNYYGHWVNGYPRPNPSGNGVANSSAANAMQASANPWTKNITISWYPQVHNSSHVNENGQWVVFRKENSSSASYTKLGTVEYKKNTRTFFTDNTSKKYNQSYVYTVVFEPTEWGKTLTNPSQAEGLYASVYTQVTQKSPLSKITATNNLENAVKVTCSYGTFENASTSNKYYVIVSRRVKGTTDWTQVHSHAITSKDDDGFEYLDKNVANACLTYQYKMSVEAQETLFEKDGAEGSIQGASSVTSVVASRGAYNGTVRLTWEVKQVGTDLTYFNLKRRLLGSRNDSDFQTIYTTSGVADSYSYEDNTAQPGTYYEYLVECYRKCKATETSTPVISYGASQQTDGFAMATGVISGRVSYGTGTAVDGVKVSLEANAADGEIVNPFHSLRITGTNSFVNLDKDLTDVFSKSWTVQMYFRTDDIKKRNTFFNAGFVNMCAHEGQINIISASNAWNGSSVYLEQGKFYNISLTGTITPSDTILTLRVIDENGKMKKKDFTSSNFKNIIKDASSKAKSLKFGNYWSSDSYLGNIDECRVWTRALGDEEVMRNYNRVLAGTEDGLYLYYKFDEGIDEQIIAYDYAKTAGVLNGNHGTIKKMDVSSLVPNENQLSVCGVTDVNGNYTISGIPFSGDGTSYTIRPSKGVHEFSPTKANRFVSAQSLVHNGVDFEDVSSFKVSGAVYYYGTSVPVQGVQFSVDGTPCTKDGTYITTDENGEFTISVPIGSHYISASKDGHTLIDASGNSYNDKAYYPYPLFEGSDAVFRTREFVKDETGLTFYDNTLVPIAGRVTGGAVEEAKPLGLGLSTNNIGRATLTLVYNSDKSLNAVDKEDGGSHYFVSGSTDRRFDVPADASCKSKAYVPADAGTYPGKTSTLVITTDSLTGEFAAMVPPLNYTVQSIVIDSNKNISFGNTNSGNDMINATNPKQLLTDSLTLDDGTCRKFKYVAALKKSYRSTPQLEIVQQDAENGAFGEYTTQVVTAAGDTVDVALYKKGVTLTAPTKEQDGYTFGYPVFFQDVKYAFDIKLHEEYTNYDSYLPDGPLVTTVPLEGTVVTFENQLGMGTSVYVSEEDKSIDGTLYESAKNEVELDENGEGTYTWRAGLPNINSYTWTLSATYGIGGQQYSWQGNGFKGIILGELTTGNNFVTSGPDDIAMILRDPPGSGSSAYIEKGQSFTTTVMRGGQVLGVKDVGTTLKHGAKTSVMTGTAAGAFVATSTDIELTTDASASVRVSEDVQMGTTNTRTVTTTERISTSDTPDYVGAYGDVFIGNATNYIFGKARQVGVTMTTKDAEPELGLTNIMTLGTSFGTQFMYSQFEVENTLLPNFVNLRNSCIHYCTTDAEYDNFVNTTDKPVYITRISPDDEERFGTSNSDEKVWKGLAAEANALEGPSYKMVLPQSAKDGQQFCDTISWFNAQISAWEQVLANNEKAKVQAINNRDSYLRGNYSFDGGSSFESSTFTASSKDFTVTSNTQIVVATSLYSGITVNGTGVSISTSTEVGGAVLTSDGSTEENTVEVGYAFMEDGDDALTVDVLNAPDGFGPIFYTRGGQTCCPYEDLVEAKYYEPERHHVLQEKTMQVEMPQLSAEVTTLTGVPSGKPANFTVLIDNISETDADCWFNINVVDTTNLEGAAVLMDGYNITNGRTILVPAGQTLKKSVQIMQTNPDVYDYEGILLRISSICQGDATANYPAIESTLALTARFQQTGSDVAITVGENALNISTGPLLHIDISDYDKNSVGLQSIRLQAKQEGDPSWVNQMEWAANDETIAEGKFQYVLDMSNSSVYPDGQWNVRAITVSNFGGKEVINASEVHSFYKDMERPQLISNPSPANGVLTADGEIAVTFNEDIRNGALTSIDNFIVTGELNDAAIAHYVAMNLTGGEGASTSASVDLDNRSFAVNMWMRYSADGEIFAHGTSDNRMKVAVNSTGNLEVTIGGKTYVSQNKLQKDKWQFLSFSYDADKQTLSADYAYDAYTVSLFSKKAVGPYTGVGTITLGQGLTGQMHEVSLWDNARPWSVAQGAMYEKKTRYTEGLMAYWRLDEGRGNTAADYARSRTLNMPSATAWHLGADNYALQLKGGTVMAAKASTIATGDNYSYTAELWFRAETAQAGKASIIGFDSSNKLDIHLATDGHLVMAANGTDYEVSATDYRDNQWHHLALNVLKSTSGNATVYVDGEALRQVPASALPAINTDNILLGGRKNNSSYDQTFKGALDEVRIWHGRRTADYIVNRMYERVSGDTEGLVAYYPFELMKLDDAKLLVSTASYQDMSATAAGEVKRVSGTTLPALSATNTAALKPAPVKQNVPFTFTASERKILIRLTDQPQRLENCNVSVTLRGVRDSHYNACENLTWDFYVRQNQLLWQQDEVAAVKRGTEAVGFEVGIANNSGSTENWSVSNLPVWLSVNSGSGSIPAISERTLRFTVNPALSIGNHEAVVYLTGNLGIPEPLVVKVNSTSQAPDWSVDAADYEYTMNINGQLKVEGVLSHDENDIVAAFRGERCVGVATPAYYQRYDAYYVLMNVYGNGEDANQPLIYKVFDASTGIVYPVVNSSDAKATTFSPDIVVGTMAQPNVWTTTDDIEQQQQLRKGWQWISFYVTPETRTVDHVFDNVLDNLSVIVSENAQWTPVSSTLTKVDAGVTYKVQLTDADALYLTGKPIDLEDTYVTVKPSWNWIGYPAPGYITLNEAFADLNPEEGDVMKSQTAFATWNESEWVGTLSALEGGAGYLYCSQYGAPKTFRYPAVSSMSNVAPLRSLGTADMQLQEIASAYPGNMNVIATVLDLNGTERHDATVSVVDAENNLRALSTATVEGRHFITVAGEGAGDMLRFVVTIDGWDYTVPGVICYADDLMVGTFSAPLLIDLSNPNGISEIAVDGSEGDGHTYNLAGQRIERTLPTQVVIRGNAKVMVNQ
ncbi:MAG: LamG-like jellyroll fold domain-containing protein [Alloprevotella sp.]